MTPSPTPVPALLDDRPHKRRLFDIEIIDGLSPSMFVGLMTPQGIVLEANRPALEATGLKPEDVLGKPFEETYWWSYSPVIQQQLRDAITRAAAGEPCRYDVRLRGAGNRFVDIDFSLQPVRDDTGQVVYLVPSGSDITERKRTEGALLESNEKFRHLTDYIADAFWIRSPDMKEVHYISPAFERIWGRSTETLYANPHHWPDYIVPEDRARVVAAFAPLTQDARTIDVEYRIVRPDGEIRWVRSRGFQVRDAADTLIRLTGIVTDITDQHRAAAAVVKSEERYRRIVETANEGISILDTESTITFVNQRFAEMFGYLVGELTGKSLFDIVPEATRALTQLRVERSRQGISEETEVEYVRKDGSSLWALLKTSPIRDVDGQWTGTLGMTTDRTRYRSAEQALRASEEQYRQIVESTTDGIIRADDVYRIVFVNRRFAEMLGYEPHEMIGKSVFTFMSAAAKVIADATIQKRRQGVQDIVDTTFRHKDGTDIAVNMAGTGLRDGEGRYVGSMGVVRDVTEQRKLQSQLMVSDRMASVGTLAAGVAHEINNPLAAVIANLDYIAESVARASGGNAWLMEEVKGPLDDAREAAQRVRFIVRDLKIFSRSPLEEPRGAVDVKTIMESAMRMAWNEIRHRAHLVKHYGTVPGVIANEARLGQVFLNLLVNAAQAMPEGRAEHNEIRVTTRLDGDRVIVAVADTGAGIPPEIVGRIFDAFFTTKAVGVGTGLGLAICQRIVTDMGGELTVESEVGKGTTFRVALPVAREEAITTAAPVEQAPVAARRGRILVVDDEELVLRSVKRTLSKEHDVVAIGTAKEALAVCVAGETFDLILCDLMMPDMTGMDLYRELVIVAPEQADRMMFITGGAFTETAQQFLEETSKEHIEKPFHAANLRAIVQRYLR